MQYLLPDLSGRLCPRCVPAVETASPFTRQRTFSQTTSSSLNEGQPWALDSFRNASMDLPRGAMNKGLPVTES